MKKTILIKINLVLITFCFFLSCKSDKERIMEKLDGAYAINKMTYDNLELGNTMTANMFSFDGNRMITFKPPIIKNQIGKNEVYKCELLSYGKDSIYIKMRTDNKYFASEFKVSFDLDYENKLLNLILESEKTQIHSSKFLQNFDIEKDDWVKIE